MRFVTFTAGTGPRLGVLKDKFVVDVQELLQSPLPLRDVRALLESDEARGAVSKLGRLLEGPHDATTHLVAEVGLLPPVLQPPTIRDHITFEEHATRQFTRDVADVWRRRPIHYYTNPSRLYGTGSTVTIPATERLDFELEIAAVVGRECSDVSAEDGVNMIFGFTVLNDWSARDLQTDEMAGGLGPCKGKDFATSLGPCVVTTDELGPLLTGGTLDVDCEVRVNDEVWAQSNAKSQYHSWGSLIAHASQDSRLVPGDILASGTVSGCSIGEAIRKGFPARYLSPGDSVELRVGVLGSLINTIAKNESPVRDRYHAHSLPPMPEVLPQYAKRLGRNESSKS